MTTTSYTYNYEGAQFTRKFSSLGAVTDYKVECFIREQQCGSIGLAIIEFQFLTLLADKNVSYLKSVTEES